MGDLLIEYRDKVTRNKKGQREETYRINRILKTPIAQKMISDITVKDINDCIEVRLRSPSQNFPQEARGLSPGRNAGFRNFFNLGPNAAKPCT